MRELDILIAALAAMLRSAGVTEIHVAEELVRETAEYPEKGVSVRNRPESLSYTIKLNEKTINDKKDKKQTETNVEDNNGIFYDIEVVLDD